MPASITGVTSWRQSQVISPVDPPRIGPEPPASFRASGKHQRPAWRGEHQTMNPGGRAVPDAEPFRSKNPGDVAVVPRESVSFGIWNLGQHHSPESPRVVVWSAI